MNLAFQPPKSLLGQMRQAARQVWELAVNLAEAALEKMGIALYRRRADYHYCPRIYGTIHHKLLDPRELEPFNGLARAVIDQGRTSLYYYRLYFIYQAIGNVSSLPNHDYSLAEVGVYKGGSTYFIAAVAEKVLGRKVLIHSFDTFSGHPDDIQPELDGGHSTAAFRDTSFAEVQRYLSGFANVILHKGRFQDTCHQVSLEKFAFVHIDVDIYSATRDCLNFFSELLVPGGIIIVDDYGFTTCRGVRRRWTVLSSKERIFLNFTWRPASVCWSA